MIRNWLKRMTGCNWIISMATSYQEIILTTNFQIATATAFIVIFFGICHQIGRVPFVMVTMAGALIG